jgi:hypothetical protein
MRRVSLLALLRDARRPGGSIIAFVDYAIQCGYSRGRALAATRPYRPRQLLFVGPGLAADVTLGIHNRDGLSTFHPDLPLHTGDGHSVTVEVRDGVVRVWLR